MASTAEAEAAEMVEPLSTNDTVPSKQPDASEKPTLREASSGVTLTAEEEVQIGGRDGG